MGRRFLLRVPNDEAEKLAAEARLDQARTLMMQALAILDSTPVATDSDAHLDLAINILGDTIADVRAGDAVFRA